MKSKPNRSSRRAFLKQGAAAAGMAIAMPHIIGASALGKDGATAPSERISMGFVGLGGQGGGHLFGGGWTYLPGGYLGREDVQVLAVCDVLRNRANEGRGRVDQRYSEKFGKGGYRSCAAYWDIRDMLLRDDIDAVLIATAYHAAANNTILAVRAGKDVYCEKPSCVSIRAGRAMVEAVRSHGRVYQGGTQQRSEYGGRFRKAVELVRSGRIGQLKEVYAYQGGGGLTPPNAAGPYAPDPPDIDWDAYLGPLPWFAYDGSTSAHRFGWGDINWGQHHYDIVQWGIGADDTGPVEIQLENGAPVYRYANGVIVHGCCPPGEKWDEGGACFIGTEGKIVVHRQKLVSDPPGIIDQSPTPEGRVYFSNSHSGNFLECVRTRQRTIVDAETAHRAASVLLLGGIAQHVGHSLKWNPAKEEFVDAPDADRLLSMATREPWRL